MTPDEPNQPAPAWLIEARKQSKAKRKSGKGGSVLVMTMKGKWWVGESRSHSVYKTAAMRESGIELLELW